MIDKRSNEGLVCIYCSEPALPDTDPPVCEEHKNIKTASDGYVSLKELDSSDQHKLPGD